jgi:osmotically inducible lipoprotein OsmB
MRKLFILSLIALPLAGCVNNDVQRGLIGAGAGAVLADVTDNSVATGAIIGGLAGTLCDDVNMCRPSY